MRILCTILNRILLIALMFLLYCDIARCSELLYDPALYDPELSVDFAQFLSTLDKEVYVSKAKQRINISREEELAYTTTTISQINRITNPAEHQKIEDALMMKLVSYYENKFKLSKPERYMLPITELPWVNVHHFTEPYFPIGNHPMRRPFFDSAPSESTHQSTPSAAQYETTTLVNEIKQSDDFEHLFVAPFDDPEDNAFFEVILPMPEQ